MARAMRAIFALRHGLRARRSYFAQSMMDQGATGVDVARNSARSVEYSTA